MKGCAGHLNYPCAVSADGDEGPREQRGRGWSGQTELPLVSLHIEAKATSLSIFASLFIFPGPARRASLPGLDRDGGSFPFTGAASYRVGSLNSVFRRILSCRTILF